MAASFVHAFHAEWLKQRRSFAGTLVIGGSLFTPLVVAIVRLIHYRGLTPIYAAEPFWQELWRSSWESMAIFFLPFAAILITSLITQIEFKSNAWKQLHALPLRTSVIFLSKLTVILVLMIEFLLLFNGGMYVSSMIPYLIISGVPHPKGSFASLPLFPENALYFIDCLPIIGAQYLMALRSNNVLIPIGIGFMAWVGALAAVSSKVAIWWPFSYTIIHYLSDKPKGAKFAAYHQLHWLAAISFVVLTVISYVLFVTKKERG